MNTQTKTSLPRPGSNSLKSYRWVRQLHLWIGAWGAIAAILFGLTGLILNHRMGANAWPQGDSKEVAVQLLPVPEAARASAESLSLWLRGQHGLDAHTLRKPRPGDAREGAAAAGGKWALMGGSARNAWSADYTPGDAQVTIKRTRHSTLAVFNRLHKGIGGSKWWTLLTDSYAIAMVLLGISGIWMWARGRSPRQMLWSVMALGIAVLLSALGFAFA